MQSNLFIYKKITLSLIGETEVVLRKCFWNFHYQIYLADTPQREHGTFSSLAMNYY